MNTDSIGVPTRREPFFRTSDYCDGFCCFCTFTQHTQLILRQQLHIVYYKWDISSTPRTCTAALCLVKAPPCSFCRRHHWSRRVRSPARAGASEAYLPLDANPPPLRSLVQYPRPHSPKTSQSQKAEFIQLHEVGLTSPSWRPVAVRTCVKMWQKVWKCMKLRNRKILFTCIQCW